MPSERKGAPEEDLLVTFEINDRLDDLMTPLQRFANGLERGILKERLATTAPAKNPIGEKSERRQLGRLRTVRFRGQKPR